MSDPQKYTVGWICAIATEFVAAQAFLDEEHDPPRHVAPHDNNSYVLGTVGSHNVVIAVLPDTEYGTTSAATVARDMLHSFPNVRIGLMVGIGGGAPRLPEHDVRLGDVVVSRAGGGKGGVLHALKGKYELRGHQLNKEVDRALKRIKNRKRYIRPPTASDRLYKAGIAHRLDGTGCCSDVSSEDPSHLVTRSQRDEEDDPKIHYGLIASANQLMKDATTRDKLAAEKDVLCFEIEAAGLMNHFPCLVVRGICDYADSHKNKEWQGFAAMTAAAYAKDILRQIPPNKVETEIPISEILGLVQGKLDGGDFTEIEIKDARITMKSDDHLTELQHWLSPPDYSTNAKLARERRHAGTGAWFLESPVSQEWKAGRRRHLWLYGLAGCGKTVLSTTILDHLSQTGRHVTLAFFFDFNDTKKQTLNGLLRSLAIQLYHTGGEAARKLDSLLASHGDDRRQPDMSGLSACVESMIKVSGNVTVVLDALDECTTKGQLLSWMRSVVSDSAFGNVQLIATGRPEAEFQQEIPDYWGQENCVSLDKKAVDADIRSYVVARLTQSSDFVDKKLPQDLLNEIRNKVGNGADGMFRWAACQLDSLAKCLSPNAIKAALKSLPHDLSETYDRMLQSIPPQHKSDAIRLLQFIVHAKRPLTVSEAIEVVATHIDGEPRGFDVRGRLNREADILRICPGLVEIAQATKGNSTTKELHLTHYSIKEYLVREEQYQGTYKETTRDFPMAKFAAEVWTGFLQDDRTFQLWGRLYQPDVPWKNDPGPPHGSKLYYACGGEYGNALQAASSEGHTNIVQLLLAKGADVNARDQRHSDKLLYAIL
ncbi:ankyrin repeat protein [Verticillium dahliae]|nr:ankyrin repeat protein [Verticillium dahliae]